MSAVLTAESPQGRRSSRFRGTASALLAGLVLALAAWSYGGVLSGDDTFIYMRYVGNALSGQGFVYNLGEPSFGTTSALWPLLMRGVAGWLGNTLEVWRAVAVGFFGLKVAFLWSCVRMQFPGRAVQGLLVLAAALEPLSFEWAASGMENSLAGAAFAFALWSWLRAVEQRARQTAIALGAALGLMPFCRPELALFSLTMAVFFVRQAGRGFLGWLLLGGAMTGVPLAGLVWESFGALLPQTAEAKRLLLAAPAPSAVVRQLGLILVAGTLAPLAGLWTARRAMPPNATGLARAVLLAWALAGGYLLAAGHLVSARYSSYLCAPVALVSAVVLARASTAAPWAALAAPLVVLIVNAVVLVRLFPATQVSEERGIREFADSCRPYLNDGARVAIQDIGVFGFSTGCYIIDTVGLTDRATVAWAKIHGRPLGRDSLDALLLARGATHYVNIFDGEVPLPRESARTVFTPLAERMILRTVTSQGGQAIHRWRIYRIEPRREAPPENPEMAK